MAGNTGFAIRIAAVDAATATIDKVNRRIAAMTAPAERFNKSIAKFGDVSGVTKLTEGMGNLSHNALDTFRSVERLVSPMASITSAASIAGMTLLVQRWSELGTQVSQTSYRLAMPADKLTSIENAGRLAGSSVEAVDSGLSTLREELYGAAWGRDPHATQVLKSLNINPGTPGKVKDTAEAMGELADRIKAMPDVHAQQRALDELGLDRSLLPLLKNGRAGLDELTQKAKDLGGGMSDKMAKDADDTRRAFTSLSVAVEGVTSRIADKLSPTVTQYLTTAADWIGKNKETADTIAEISAGILSLSALKPAAWVMRLLGLGAFVPGAGAALVGGTLAAGAAAGGMNMPMTDDYGRIVGNWGGGNQAEPSAPPAGWAPGAPGWFMRHWHQVTDPGPAKDVTLDPTKRAFLDTIAGPESGGDYQAKNGGSRFTDMSQFPDYVGPGGTSTASGRYQFVSGTWRSVARAIGANDFKPENQDKGGWYLAETVYRAKTGRDLEADLKEGGHQAQITDALKEQWPSLPGGTQQLETLDQFKAAFERHSETEAHLATPPATPAVVPPVAQPAAPTGHVQVDLHVKHDGSSATATVTTKGQVSASPPRIERSMPMVP